MVRWKASDLGIPTAPATQGGAGLERNMHFHNITVDSHLTSILGGQFVTDFGGNTGRVGRPRVPATGLLQTC